MRTSIFGRLSKNTKKRENTSVKQEHASRVRVGRPSLTGVQRLILINARPVLTSTFYTPYHVIASVS